MSIDVIGEIHGRIPPPKPRFLSPNNLALYHHENFQLDGSQHA